MHKKVMFLPLQDRGTIQCRQYRLATLRSYGISCHWHGRWQVSCRRCEDALLLRRTDETHQGENNFSRLLCPHTTLLIRTLYFFYVKMLTHFLRFINPSLSIMICGHFSREELDAASLANTVSHLFFYLLQLSCTFP